MNEKTEQVEIEVEEENPPSLEEMFSKVKRANRNRAKARRRALRAQGYQVGFK